MNKLITLSIIIAAFSLSGCGVYHAANYPFSDHCMAPCLNGVIDAHFVSALGVTVHRDRPDDCDIRDMALMSARAVCEVECEKQIKKEKL